MKKRGLDPRSSLQNDIRQRWGREKLTEAETRLCRCCSFRLLHGRPCMLLPLTLEGADCPYHAVNKDQYGEVIWNG